MKSFGGTIIEFGFIKWTLFPLYITKNSKQKWVRKIGLLIVLPWFYTIGVIGLLITFVGLIIFVFEEI